MPDPELDALKAAVKGLVFRSETDEPLHPFVWKGDGGPLTGEKVLRLGKLHPKTEVEDVGLDDVLGTQTEGYEGQTEAEKKNVEGFKDLVKVLKGKLADVRAFRVGEPNVRYFIVGRTKGGDWAGVWTKAVET